jgi:hypothetical protein
MAVLLMLVLPPPLVCTSSDLVEYGSENAVKAAGKYRQQGKTYEVVDGDICFWSASPPAVHDLPFAPPGG